MLRKVSGSGWQMLLKMKENIDVRSSMVLNKRSYQGQLHIQCITCGKLFLERRQGQLLNKREVISFPQTM